MRFKKAIVFGVVLVMLLAVALLLAPVFIIEEHAVPEKSFPPPLACGDVCSLIIEPNDGITPVRSLLQHAVKSIDLVMYELQDKSIEADLISARSRGVAVRVLLSPGYEGEPSIINQAAYGTLREHGVSVRWSPDHFALTHEKSVVIDDTTAIIMSFNLVPKYYPTGRDFGIVDHDSQDVAAMENAFEGDWQGSVVAASAGRDLVWSPGSRNAITALIDAAQSSLDIYNEEMADDGIIAALIRAALRGVAVRIDMTYAPDWKAAFNKLIGAQATVRTYGKNAPLYIHAKMIIADNDRAFIGSENFSETSLDENRELGIIISRPDIIQSLRATFDADWAGAAPEPGS